MTNKQFITKLNKLKKRIAQDQDDLRELISEASDLVNVCDQAIEDMERAADSLSELV